MDLSFLLFLLVVVFVMGFFITQYQGFVALKGGAKRGVFFVSRFFYAITKREHTYIFATMLLFIPLMIVGTLLYDAEKMWPCILYVAALDALLLLLFFSNVKKFGKPTY